MSNDFEPEISDFELDLPYEMGRYLLDAEIGRGGMGAVYHATDTMLDRPVAVKVLLPQLAADRQFVQRFTREAQMAARLEHPNIVTVHDVGNQDSLVYFVMRMVMGKPLDHLIEEGIPWPRAEAIALQVADAMAYAHEEGVIHRDIKPENVIVSKDNTVTITDFGLARPEQQGKGGPTQAGVILGTPGYMAPEQALGGDVDHRADIYAFGVMLFELATGQLPFDGETAFSIINQHISTPPPTLRSVNAKAPVWLNDLIDKCLKKKPADRIGSMRDVAEALRDNQGSQLKEVVAGEVSAQDIVSKIRSGQETLASALSEFPQFADTLQEVFRQEMTVVSFDLAGSTALKQSGGGTIALGPVFNAYRELVEGAMRESHVVESIWAGDGTVAIFNQPSEAITTAQSIVRGLREVNKQFPNTPDLGVRVGIHTGSVLRDPNQPLGQVTSTTLDLTGHIQKDAKVGLVEISQATLDKLVSQEGWIPIRKSRDADLMIFGWHPDGPDKVPQSWVSRMRYGRGQEAEEAAEKEAPAKKPAAGKPAPGKPPAKERPGRDTRTPARRQPTKPDATVKLSCAYCEADVTVKDQKCPSCGRLNRHYDPALAEGRRKRTTVTPPARKKQTTMAGRAADPRRTTGTGRTTMAGQRAQQQQQTGAEGQAVMELLFGMVMTIAVWLAVGYAGKGSPANGWWWTGGANGTHTRWVSLLLPGALMGLLAWTQRATQPAMAAGIFFGMPAALALLKILTWWA